VHKFLEPTFFSPGYCFFLLAVFCSPASSRFSGRTFSFPGIALRPGRTSPYLINQFPEPQSPFFSLFSLSVFHPILVPTASAFSFVRPENDFLAFFLKLEPCFFTPAPQSLPCFDQVCALRSPFAFQYRCPVSRIPYKPSPRAFFPPLCLPAKHKSLIPRAWTLIARRQRYLAASEKFVPVPFHRVEPAPLSGRCKTPFFSFLFPISSYFLEYSGFGCSSPRFFTRAK